MKGNLCLLLLPCLLSACSSGYIVRGTTSLNDIEGKLVRLKALKNDLLVVIDSSAVVHNTFSMRGQVDSVQMVTLFLDDQGIMPIVLEDGSIEVIMDAERREASGTTLNDALYRFFDQVNAIDTQIGTLIRKSDRMLLDGTSFEDAQKLVKQEQDSLEAKKTEVITEFIHDNYETVLGPEVFLMICSSSLPYPMLTPQIKAWLDDAPYVFKNHPIVRSYVKQAEENMKRIEEQRRMLR